MELFSHIQDNSHAPLAERLRPQDLAEVIGQDHLLKDGGFIERQVRKGQPASIVLWGPPGCGKTTIARLYAQAFQAHFEQVSAVFSGVADLRKVVAAAKDRLAMGGRTALFVDEIHRFNKAQQDAFLPFVEDGTLILVGATTENPSFELNSALLSRVQVLPVKSLDEEGLAKLLVRAEEEVGKLPLTQKARASLMQMAAGDGRYFLGLVEAIASENTQKELDVEDLGQFLQKRIANYDKDGEQHYDLISALHKSVRGSDTDGALYWLARMLDGGEDPLFIARRLVRMASEEIAMADPQALVHAVAARDSYLAQGSPEGELALAECVVYLSTAPKSNAVYKAFKSAMVAAKQTREFGPPMFARNAPTRTMKELGYGEGYKYDHDSPNAFSGQNYFPTEMDRVNFYQPNERGFEREVQKRMYYFNKNRQDVEK